MSFPPEHNFRNGSRRPETNQTSYIPRPEDVGLKAEGHHATLAFTIVKIRTCILLRLKAMSFYVKIDDVAQTTQKILNPTVSQVIDWMRVVPALRMHCITCRCEGELWADKLTLHIVTKCPGIVTIWCAGFAAGDVHMHVCEYHSLY